MSTAERAGLYWVLRRISFNNECKEWNGRTTITNWKSSEFKQVADVMTNRDDEFSKRDDEFSGIYTLVRDMKLSKNERRCYVEMKHRERMNSQSTVAESEE